MGQAPTGNADGHLLWVDSASAVDTLTKVKGCVKDSWSEQLASHRMCVYPPHKATSQVVENIGYERGSVMGRDLAS